LPADIDCDIDNIMQQNDTKLNGLEKSVSGRKNVIRRTCVQYANEISSGRRTAMQRRLNTLLPLPQKNPQNTRRKQTHLW